MRSYSLSSDVPLIPAGEFLSEEEFQRRRLRSGHKMLSKFVEKPAVAQRDIDRDGSRREVAHLLDHDDTSEFAPDHGLARQKAQQETEKLLGYASISRRLKSFDLGSHRKEKKKKVYKLPERGEPHIKEPSKVLPPEAVITLKDAFHSGAKIGSGSFLFYRVPDYAKSFIGKRPWPRAGKIAHMVDLVRNEARVINKNITRLMAKFEALKIEFDHDAVHYRLKALLLVFLLEENIYKLKTALGNLKTFNGLLAGNACIGIFNTIVKDKSEPQEPEPYNVARDQFYEEETKLLEKLAHDVDLIEGVKYQLDRFDLTSEHYAIWKEQHWRELRMQINRYKGGGCMLGLGLQGLVISLINTGIAAGLHSPAAAAAAGFYAVTSVARIVQTGVRTHLENNLVKHAVSPFEQVTMLDSNSSAAVRKTHSQLEMLHKVEIAVNEIEGLGNSAFNISGTLTGLPLSTGRPATVTPPVQSISAPIAIRSHNILSAESTHQVSYHRRKI